LLIVEIVEGRVRRSLFKLVVQGLLVEKPHGK